MRAVKFVLDTRSKALRFKPKFNQKTTKYGISVAIATVITQEIKIPD